MKFDHGFTQMNTDNKLKYKDLSEIIIKSFYDVYNELGWGFLESVYEKALAIVLKEKGLSIERQKAIPVFFRNQDVGDFRADIVVENKIILELKTVLKLESIHEAQILNYLKATAIEIGFLMNFGKQPQFKRFIFDNEKKSVKIGVNPWSKRVFKEY